MPKVTPFASIASDATVPTSGAYSISIVCMHTHIACTHTHTHTHTRMCHAISLALLLAIAAALSARHFALDALERLACKYMHMYMHA